MNVFLCLREKRQEDCCLIKKKSKLSQKYFRSGAKENTKKIVSAGIRKNSDSMHLACTTC